MSAEEIIKFYKDLKLEIENPECLIAAYLLGFNSFQTITEAEFKSALAKYGVRTVK